MASPVFRLSRTASCAALLVLLAACGGGSGTPENAGTATLFPDSSASQPPTPQASPQTPPTASPETPPSPIPEPPPSPDPARPTLAMPGAIANGSVIALECGRRYHGTLDLKGKSDVTVRTAGDCGPAVLSPGEALQGWTQHQGAIYSAPLPAGMPADIAQVIIDGQPQPLAHWPNKPQTWARAAASSAGSLTYAMPNGDLAGATLVFRPHAWAVEARRITGYADAVMSVSAFDNINFDGYALGGAVDFYVEGKLWMLDGPGEWAVSEGRVYVWTPDGQSPEGRNWVAPQRDGIDASGSARVKLENIAIHGAANGINALNARDLNVKQVHITNASANGILNSGGKGLQVDGAIIRNVRHQGISVHWGGGGESIRNSHVEAAGSIGMPTQARSAIHLTSAAGATVANNTVKQSGYIGIRVFRDSTVSGNTVDGACLVLTDCGGIYIDAQGQNGLNTRIEDNTVRNVGKDQRLAWGVYLGEGTNGVTVSGNTLRGNGNGLEILNGYDNRITGNTFTQNTQAHIQMVEFGGTPRVTNNVVSGNTFTTVGKEEMYRLSSERGTSAVTGFAAYADNRYFSSASLFANYNGEALSFAQWQARTGQDADSTLALP